MFTIVETLVGPMTVSKDFFPRGMILGLSVSFEI
jgi:hypothetical protein